MHQNHHTIPRIIYIVNIYYNINVWQSQFLIYTQIAMRKWSCRNYVWRRLFKVHPKWNIGCAEVLDWKFYSASGTGAECWNILFTSMFVLVKLDVRENWPKIIQIFVHVLTLLPCFLLIKYLHICVSMLSIWGPYLLFIYKMF